MNHLIIQVLVTDLEWSRILHAFFLGSDEPDQLRRAISKGREDSLVFHQPHALVHEFAILEYKACFDLCRIGVGWDDTTNPLSADDIVWLGVEVVVSAVLINHTNLERRDLGWDMHTHCYGLVVESASFHKVLESNMGL